MRKFRDYEHNNRQNRNVTFERRNQKEALSPYEDSVRFLESFQGISVKLRDGESVDQLIRRFRKTVEYSGLMHELKRRESYLSPSEKHKEKKRRAAKKLKKRAKKFASNSEDRK